MKLLLCLALVSFGAHAARADYQEVRTNLYTFQREGVLLTSGSKVLLDYRDYLRDPRNRGRARMKILSAAGPVVSAYAEGALCDDAGAACGSWQAVKALDGQGRKVFLDNLLVEGSLLRALKRDPYLLKSLKAAGRETYQRFLSAARLSELQALLEKGFEGDGGHVSLEDGKLDSFSLYAYDERTNRLTVRVALLQQSGSVSDVVMLGLVVEPNASFAQELELAKFQGLGLFQSQR